MAANPITFNLTADQLDQITSYTTKPTVTLRARVVGQQLVIERIDVKGTFLALNRYTKPLRKR